MRRTEERLAAGAGPDVIRLSVGIEDIGDLIADLDRALDLAGSVASSLNRAEVSTTA